MILYVQEGYGADDSEAETFGPKQQPSAINVLKGP